MSRTADSPFWCTQRAIQLVFCFLIGCLAVHFLVEDALLFAASAPLDPAAASVSALDYEEFEHLDDLAYTASMTWKVANPSKPAGFLWIAVSIQRACFPIFQPPKF